MCYNLSCLRPAEEENCPICLLEMVDGESSVACVNFFYFVNLKWKHLHFAITYLVLDPQKKRSVRSVCWKWSMGRAWWLVLQDAVINCIITAWPSVSNFNFCIDIVIRRKKIDPVNIKQYNC